MKLELNNWDHPTTSDTPGNSPPRDRPMMMERGVTSPPRERKNPSLSQRSHRHLHNHHNRPLSQSITADGMDLKMASKLGVPIQEFRKNKQTTTMPSANSTLERGQGRINNLLMEEMKSKIASVIILYYSQSYFIILFIIDVTIGLRTVVDEYRS
jgi:hypothetical protein